MCRLKTIYLNKTRDWRKSQYSFASLSSSTSNAFRARFSSSFIARSSFTLANLRASCVQMQRNWSKMQGIRCEKILPWTTLSAIQKKEQEEFRQVPLVFPFVYKQEWPGSSLKAKDGSRKAWKFQQAWLQIWETHREYLADKKHDVLGGELSPPGCHILCLMDLHDHKQQRWNQIDYFAKTFMLLWKRDQARAEMQATATK